MVAQSLAIVERSETADEPNLGHIIYSGNLGWIAYGFYVVTFLSFIVIERFGDVTKSLKDVYFMHRCHDQNLHALIS